MLEAYLGLVNSVIHVIESLMSQEEIPDELAEEKDELLAIYQQLLAYEVSFESRFLPKVKSKIVKILTQYSVKFNDDFGGFLHPFFKLVNQQVAQGKFRAVKANDRLIQNTVTYYKQLIHDPQVKQEVLGSLGQIFENLILPNIAISQEDLETFEFEPETFVKEDLEETDQESRRRNCMHLVNTFTKAFRQESMAVLNQVLQAFNAQYNENRDQNWAQKVGLLNLILASQIQQYSIQFGANKITIDEQELMGYFQSLILPEIDEVDVNKHPVVKAACMKFLFYFRAQISPQVALELLPKISR